MKNNLVGNGIANGINSFFNWYEKGWEKSEKKNPWDFQEGNMQTKQTEKKQEKIFYQGGNQNVSTLF